MLRSLDSGVSGLRNHQLKIDVIGNNIANVNTVGFKSQRVEFQNLLNQTLSFGTSRESVGNGTNPKQVGLGVGVGSITTIHTQGALQGTGKSTDLAIQGEGFFVVSDGSRSFYTRDGSFDFDKTGSFIRPANGLKVMGWNTTNGVIDTTAEPAPIRLARGQNLQPKATGSVRVKGNLRSDSVDTMITGVLKATPRGAAEAGKVVMQHNILNSKNQVIHGTITMVNDPGTLTWQVSYRPRAGDLDADQLTNSGEQGLGTLTFDTSGHLTSNTLGAIRLAFTQESGASSIECQVIPSQLQMNAEVPRSRLGFDTIAGLISGNLQPAVQKTTATLGGLLVPATVGPKEVKLPMNLGVTSGTVVVEGELILRNSQGSNSWSVSYLPKAGATGQDKLRFADEQNLGVITFDPATGEPVGTISLKDIKLLAKDTVTPTLATVTVPTLATGSALKLGASDTVAATLGATARDAVIKETRFDIANARTFSSETNLVGNQVVTGKLVVRNAPGEATWSVTYVPDDTPENRGLINSTGEQQLGTFSFDTDAKLTTTDLEPIRLQYQNKSTPDLTAHLDFGDIGFDPNETKGLEEVIQTSGKTDAGSFTMSMNFFDSLGNSHSGNILFTRDLEQQSAADGRSKWRVSFGIVDPQVKNDLTSLPGPGVGPFPIDLGYIIFDNGGLPVDVNLSPLKLNYTSGAAPSTISFDPGKRGDSLGLTQFLTASTAIIDDQDGYATGSLQGFNINSNGYVSGVFTNGQIRQLAQIALATFNNPNGLVNEGNNMWTVGNASGDAQVGTAGTAGRGLLASSNLETSNVDLAASFSDLIISQRGLQANSRIITTSDEVLQELMGLKR
jgi:flagellar hook protein FlgE